MSYEKRQGNLKDAFNKLIRSYGAPLGMVLFIVLAALYIFMARGNSTPTDFPRSSPDFIQSARAERLLADLARTLEENPDDIKALDESGRLKFQLGQPRYIEAIADLERARELGLADARSFYYLGVMYQSVGLYDFAAQEYRRFLNNFPKDAEVRMLLAKLYYAAGDFPGAVREYEALLRDGVKDPVLLENLALARWQNKQDYSGALSELRAGGAAGAFLADYTEGRIKYESKDYAGAQPLLSRAASAAPSAGSFADRVSLLWMTGDSAWRNKDEAAAYPHMQDLMQAAPDHEEGRRLLAKLEKSRAAAEKAAAKAAAAAAKKAAKVSEADKK